MFFTNDSLTIVLLGDWNRYYIQPDWIAANVYAQQKIELGVSGQGTNFSVTYRCNDIIIAPSQSQMVFTAQNAKNETINMLVFCINNFMQKAKTPILNAYGLNCDYVDSNGTQFAEVIDGMTDISGIIDCGYEIKASKITRSLFKNDVVLNLESFIEGGSVKMHFNEHHAVNSTQMPTVTTEQINSFLNECKQLVKAFGYEIEGEE